MIITHTWTINRFAELYRNTREHRLSFMQSNVFPQDNYPNRTFFLRLHPKNVDKVGVNRIAIALHRQEGEDELSFLYKIIILDETKMNGKEIKGGPLNTKGTELICKKIIEQEKLSNLEKGYLVSGAIKIYCKIKILYEEKENNFDDSQTESDAGNTINRLEDFWNVELQFFKLYHTYANQSYDIALSSKNLNKSQAQHNYKFFIRMWLSKKDRVNYLSVYLYLLNKHDKHEQVKVQYSISLSYENLYKFCVKSNEETIFSCKKFGWNEFISLEELLHKNKNLLTEGKLKIDCKIDVVDDKNEPNESENVKKESNIYNTKNQISSFNDSFKNSMTNCIFVKQSDVKIGDVNQSTGYRSFCNII